MWLQRAAMWNMLQRHEIQGCGLMLQRCFSLSGDSIARTNVWQWTNRRYRSVIMIWWEFGTATTRWGRGRDHVWTWDGNCCEVSLEVSRGFGLLQMLKHSLDLRSLASQSGCLALIPPPSPSRSWLWKSVMGNVSVVAMYDTTIVVLVRFFSRTFLPQGSYSCNRVEGRNVSPRVHHSL